MPKKPKSRHNAEQPSWAVLGGDHAPGAERVNQLLYGDNLHIMRQMAKASVDLIYLDPPFKSDQTYNLIYSTYTGRPIPEQAQAFNDTWEMDVEKVELAKTMPMLLRQHDVDEYYVQFWELWIRALRDTQPHLLAYLIYMVERLLHMKTILKPTGSLYLHCDPTASHYIKVMMDGIFHHNNFRNEIIWKRTHSHGGAKRWGPIHDTILFYTMSDSYTWNDVYQDYDEDYKEDYYRFSDQRGRFRLVTLTGAGTRTGDSGKPWRGIDPTTVGRHWAVPAQALARLPNVGDVNALTTQQKLDLLDAAGVIYWPTRGSVPQQKRYLDEAPGVKIQDMIADIAPISSQARERLGYQTQKPVPLLRRIIEASSNRGDVVFDPFCGCGTTIYAAHETGRRWIGCDVAILAVRIVEEQLQERYGLVRGEHYEEHGIPNSVESAQALWDENKFQFEHWAVEYVEGFPTKKTGDEGVDGRIYFEADGTYASMVLSVKGGGVRPTDVRDLIGVLSSEPGARLAGFISLQEPSKAMRSAAAKAGKWEYRGTAYERVQLLTVREILEEQKSFHTPSKIGTKAVSVQHKLALY
jgi:DNA modification methylase